MSCLFFLGPLWAICRPCVLTTHAPLPVASLSLPLPVASLSLPLPLTSLSLPPSQAKFHLGDARRACIAHGIVDAVQVRYTGFI